MVRYNGNNFIVYELDTQESIIQRLASEMKSIPRYLYFPDGIPSVNDFYVTDGNIIVENLLSVIISKETSMNFLELFEKIKDKIIQNNLDLREDVLYPFVAFNRSIISTPVFARKELLYSIEEPINNAKIFDELVDLQKIWDEKRTIIINTIKEAVESILNKVEKQKELFDKYGNITEDIEYTLFELERVTFESELNLNNITIMELFNHIKLTPGVPFASIAGIYKILKDFVPITEWSDTLDNAILLKVLQKSDMNSIKITDYTDVIITLSEEEYITVGMRLSTSGQYLKQDKMIKRVLEIITGYEEIEIKSVRETRVNGVFYFPLHTMNKYIMSDLIMNNPLFSSIMSVDESDKASKKKNSVYIHFKHPSTGSVNVNVTEKISQKGDASLRGKDVKDKFYYGSTYIRVKISSAQSVQNIKIFQRMFAKFLYMYDKEYATILKEYKKYIEDFGKVIPKIIKNNTNLKLKDIAPEVFVAGYPPKCPIQPEIIDDEEAEEAKKAGKSIMRYPISADEGFPTRNYICNNPKAPYPGLRENPLSNNDIVPYLPCCYNKDHEKKPGSIYRHYYYGEERRIKMEAGQQDMIITNKFVPKDKYGTLPEGINKLFDILDYKDGNMFVRKGVSNTKSSFLECVMEGMFEETDILEYQNFNEIKARLESFRHEIAIPSLSSLCRQTMYDFSVEDIMEYIRNPNIYFDPKYFVPLLENILNCNIYVFNRINLRNGQLSIPRHTQAYYKTRKNAKTIFIYEHIGSKSDHSTYPRCELIVRWKIGGTNQKDVSYYFNDNTQLTDGVRQVFNKLCKTYALNIQIPETIFDINYPNIQITEQGIDSYGKSRMLRFVYKNVTGTLLTQPQSPLPVIELKNWNIIKINIKIAKKFIQETNMVITKQSVKNNLLSEIHGVIGNLQVSIPVNDTNPLDDVDIVETNINYSINNYSIIDNYNKYKKLARYITEYLYWLYSRYLYQKNKLDANDVVISEFIKEKIEIDPDFEYGQVGKIFDTESGVMKNGKLILKSEETLKRLIYTLRVFTRRYRKKLMNYHNHIAIENYYQDITDFDHYGNQVILQGKDSVEKWIQEQKLKYVLHDSVQVGNLLPYFFRNSMIDSNIYLAQNTDTIQKVFHIVQLWNNNTGYNPGENPQIDEKLYPSYTLYKYINKTNITSKHIPGTTTKLDIKVLGYKIQGIVQYTVLLKL